MDLVDGIEDLEWLLNAFCARSLSGFDWLSFCLRYFAYCSAYDGIEKEVGACLAS